MTVLECVCRQFGSDNRRVGDLQGHGKKREPPGLNGIRCGR